MEDLTDTEIHELFDDVAWATKSFGWTIEHDDIVQELWLWHLTKPGNRNWMKIKDPKKRRGALKREAYKIGSAKLKEDSLFYVKYDYAVDVVKMILKGEIKGDQSVEDLAHAIENLREQNEDYADIIIRRYYSDDGTGMNAAERKRLSRAHERLTDEMNRIARERAAEFEEVPGGTLGDGLGRPKPIPFKLEDIQREPQVAQGYYGRRTSDNTPRIPRHEPKSLDSIRR